MFNNNWFHEKKKQIQKEKRKNIKTAKVICRIESSIFCKQKPTKILKIPSLEGEQKKKKNRQSQFNNLFFLLIKKNYNLQPR